MASAQTTAASAKRLPVFTWEGKSRTGETKKGEMEAADVSAVNARLRQMQIQPSRVRRKGAGLRFRLPGVGGVGTKDLVVFTRQFSTMIDAGLPLVQCLDILATQTDNPAFREVLSRVKGKVEQGATFADSLKEHPRVFDELYVQLVAAGEIGGILDTILNRLAAYIEKAQKLKGKIKGALMYPVGVLVVGVVVTVVLMLYVTPVFERMFNDFGEALPAPTQFVIDLSKWLEANILALVGVGAAAGFGLRAVLASPRGRELFDDLALRSPLFGPLIRKIAVARFTRTLGTMISSGVPILDALDVTAKTAGNRTVERAIRHARNQISEGKTITQPLAETRVFPSMVVQMIGVGEATGAMDTMLAKIADFYDDEVDSAVGALTSLIEPVMMVFLGGVVGGFLVAMYLPIFSIAGAIK
jgi:type IV pilus assembly protein PilC